MARSAVRWSTVLREQVNLQISRGTSAQAIHAAVAQKSRFIRDTAIQQGRASPVYVTKVDGRRGAAEETAHLSGGTITYVFSQLAQAANWALDECRKRSPVRSGAFRKSWAVLVDGKLWDAAPATIPMGTEVWIVNTMPYARKIEVGGQKIKVDPQIVEAVRQIVPRRFNGIKAQRAFKPLAGGRDARGGPVPYILKGAGVASGLSWNRKNGWTRKHTPYVSNRGDRQAGEQVLYPTLILTERIT
ncbi:hypothetical protein [Acetobacter syzygii]|uniref:hypothetical protein n=1 Tax=Acetobacter syzygii TaxID=146476 RepID=UPI00156D4A73|nr:hypothetical protein [Acetobacter syzygii]NSL92913.1 hypothetical protein [Acetobacter syzygii]